MISVSGGIAFLKGLLGFSKITSWIASITGAVGTLGGLASFGWLGPAAPFVLGFFKALGKLISWTWQGAENIVTHPVTLIICAGFWLHGFYIGKRVDANEVASAKAQFEYVVARQKEANHVEDKKAKDAIAARDAAKKTLPPLAVDPGLPPPPAKTASAAALPKPPAGVRKGGRGNKSDCGFLLCF